MNIIITGGFGHIGSELLRKFVKAKKINKIFIIDNFLTQRFNSYINIKKKKIILFDEDLNKFSFKKINSKIDFVIHLAAITNAEKSVGKENEILQNNLNGTKKIVNFCKRRKIHLIFASSTSVYGDQSKIINSKNNTDPKMINPQSPYAECKIYEENYIKKNLQKFTILRLGTICGISPGIRFHTAINKFSYQAALSKPITIWRKLYTKKRPYLILNDFVRLVEFIFFKKKIFGIFDVVSENHAVIDIVKIIKVYKKNLKLKFVNTKILNQKSYIVIPDEIKRKGFKFTGKVKDEIKKTLKILC
ncbi:SDR family oxidoreductase [Candidatus Pelagibacter sp.]|uniref:SDR family oxidoreductase n=1 Tax=Candidatus Pelagibacter sp. TaxID=2024849 RepID=UPI003F879546